MITPRTSFATQAADGLPLRRGAGSGAPALSRLDRCHRSARLTGHADGQRPILAAGNTDGDLAMLQWTAASLHRTLQLFVHHTDGDREYAYDRDPVLGSGTEQIQAAATDHKGTVIDMAADWPLSTRRPLIRP